MVIAGVMYDVRVLWILVVVVRSGAFIVTVAVEVVILVAIFMGSFMMQIVGGAEW